MRSTEIAQLGHRFEIGGHTQDHLRLTQIALHLVEGQIRNNKQWLEDLLGCEIPGFAYVGGRHNRIVRRLVEKTGYRYARTIKSMMSAPGPDRFQVPTTTQFFPHRKTTYIRNYIKGGPTFRNGQPFSPLCWPTRDSLQIYRGSLKPAPAREDTFISGVILGNWMRVIFGANLIACSVGYVKFPLASSLTRRVAGEPLIAEAETQDCLTRWWNQRLSAESG